MATETPTPFGAKLKRYRAAAGLTQEELAARAGLSVRGISDLERGRRASPYYDTVRLLADALELDAEDRAILLAAARANAQSPRHTPVEAPGNLPAPLTSLIGRTDDIRTVCQLLSQPDVRLVTLTGTGGVGKTRLAIQVAFEVQGSFPDGVYFVALAALRDPALVLTTIARALGLQEASDDSIADRLIVYLRDKRLLLVLDNFEHLLAAAPETSALLTACSGVKILTTSRVRLHLTGEHEFTVAPLALPNIQESPDVERWSQVPAVALFLDRMRAIDPRFTLTMVDAPSVAEICVHLDGLPLAIELAVARGKHLTIQELAARLQHRLQILTHGPRDLPERQQTLRATIAWSYALLAPDEQRLLRWLAAFVGGWTLETAEALCADANGLADNIVDGLAALVDSSLVHVERGPDGHARYGMLETIREFAVEQLAASGEGETVRRCHADVMKAFTEQAERGLQSAERVLWVRAAVAEVDNVRAALRWSLEHDEIERALVIVGNMIWFWDVIGGEAEGWAWSKAVLDQERADRHSWAYARALYATGELAWHVGEFATSSRLLCESIALFRALGDQRSLGQALLQLASTLVSQGEPTQAHDCACESVAIFETVDDPWNLSLSQFVLGEALLSMDVDASRVAYERSLDTFRALGDVWGVAVATTGLGGLAMRQRDYAAARTLFEEGLALRRAIAHPMTVAISITSLGELARRAGDDARAGEFLNEGLSLFRNFGFAERTAWALYELGMVAIHRVDMDAAGAALAESLTLRVEHGNEAQVAQTIAGLARVALMRGSPERAARLLGAVEAIRAAHDIAAPADEDGDEERRTLADVQARLGSEATSAALAYGRTLTQTEAVALALER